MVERRKRELLGGRGGQALVRRGSGEKEQALVRGEGGSRDLVVERAEQTLVRGGRGSRDLLGEAWGRGREQRVVRRERRTGTCSGREGRESC